MRTELDRRAREILEGNDRGGYTVPNGRVYPFQWNWDSAFVALGFASFNEDRAWREIETLFDAQWSDGFLPHIVFWKDDAGYFPGPAVWGTGRSPLTSGITQPPVAATVVRALWAQATDKLAARARVERLFPKLLAWHRWFARVRDPLGQGLVVATHPWETGRDNSPEWDAPSQPIDISGVGAYQRRDTTHLDQSMRPTKVEYDRYLALVQFGRNTGWNHDRIARENPFRVVDVGMTMIMLRANRDLLALAQEIGLQAESEELRRFIARAESGVRYLWDDALGCYCSRDLITERSSGFVTSASFLSFYAGLSDETIDAQLLAHLERIAGRVKYLVPSLDPFDKGFDSIRYWRGPVWAVVNYMVGSGLIEAGYTSWGTRICSDTRALIEGAGFYESFCPITGRGTGGNDFSWTAAMWLHWARHAERDSHRQAQQLR
jgi:glycogen debranching enzyme